MVSRMYAFNTILAFFASFDCLNGSCLDISSNPVTISYSSSQFGHFLVRLSQEPTTSIGCYLELKDSSGTMLVQLPSSSLSPCEESFIIDTHRASSIDFQYNYAYTIRLIGTDNAGSPVCSSDPLSINLSAPSVAIMHPSMLRFDGESISIKFSSPVNVGLCQVSLVTYNGVTLSPSPKKKGPCSSYLTFMSDNRVVAMRPGDTVVVEWSYYEDGITETYSSSPISMGAIPSTFSCNQPLSLLRSQNGISYIGITSPAPYRGNCSLVIDSCTPSHGSPTTIPFTACAQYAIVSIDSLSLQSSPTTCSFHWRYEYNSQSCVSAPSTSITLTIRERCLITSSPVSVDNSFKTAFVFETSSSSTTTNQRDCIVRLLSCGSTTFEPPIEKRVANCVPSVADFSISDSPLIVNGALCNVDFIRVPTGDPSSSSAYSCQSDPLTIRVGPQPPAWPPTASSRITYPGNNCVIFSWDPYTPLTPNCYQVDQYQDTSEWIPIGGGETGGLNCVLSLSVSRCLPSLVSDYRFRVRAYIATRDGWSSNHLPSKTFKISDFHFPSNPQLLSPTFSPNTVSVFQSNQFPTLTVSSQDTSDSHLFVAKLMARSKPDVASGYTVILPLEPGDVGYVNITSISAFTYTFIPDPSSPGLYSLSTYSFAHPLVPIGDYSLVIFSLQPGGLMGQYYATPLFVDQVDTKYEAVNFQGPVVSPTVGWPFAPLTLYEQLSVRWTGFIEPQFTEKTVFTIQSFGYFGLWIDDQVVIDNRTIPCSSGSCSSTPIQLRVSPWVPARNPSARVKLFHSIRIDYMVMKDRDTGPTTPGIVLKWSSRSIPSAVVVPVSQLYAGQTIVAIPSSPASFPLINIVPGPTDLSRSTLSGPSGSVPVGVSTNVFIQTRDSLGQATSTNCFESFIARFTLKSDPSTTVVTESSVNEGGSACNGLYRVPVTFEQIGDYDVQVEEANSNVAVSGSSLITIHVVAGPATTIQGPFFLTVPKTLATTRVYFNLLDSFGYQLDGSDLGGLRLPEINILSEWLYDAPNLARLGSEQFILDTERLQVPTVVSPLTAWDADELKFFKSVEFAVSGRLQVSVRIGDDGSTLVSGETDVIGNSNSFDPSKSVIVPSIQPLPLSVVAGTLITFKVQLRDANENVLQGFPDPLPAVYVEVFQSGTARIIDAQACQPSLTLSGVFDCVPTLNIASDNIFINITVNGMSATMILDQLTFPGKVEISPIRIEVLPANLDPTKTVWSGVPRVLRKGVSHETFFTFFDEFGNSFGDQVDEFENVEVKFLDSSSNVVYTENRVVFRQGKLRLMLAPSVVSTEDATSPDYTGFQVRLTVAGQIVTPFGTTTYIRVIRGSAEADDITCTTNPAPQLPAGTAASCTCTGLSSGEYLTWSFGSIENEFAYNPVGLDYSVSAGESTAGVYSVHATLKQRGGLEARYYIDPNFRTVISPSPSGIVSAFTRVDSFLEFEFGDEIEVQQATALSVEWTGYIDPPESVNVMFSISATGGVQFILGGLFLIDTLADHESEVAANVSTLLTAGVASPVSIKFRPRSGGSTFSILWSYVTEAFVPIPPRALLRDVIIPSSVIETYTVVPAVISPNSRVTISPTASSNQIFRFSIDAVDDNNNDIGAPSSCRVSGGVFPGCLFQITTTPAGALIGLPTITHVSGGQYLVEVTLGAFNPVLLYVQLAMGGGTFTDLLDSPFTLGVF